MNFKVEHAIIAVLVLALLYYVISHYHLMNKVQRIYTHPEVKALKDKHLRTQPCPSWCRTLTREPPEICKQIAECYYGF